MTPSPHPHPRRWFVPQFSLRALFVLVTLSAIGTAVWYRWPIVEEVDLYAQFPPQVKARTTPQKMKAMRAVDTYRRVWGGKRVRHGWARRYDFQGRLVSEVLWREGVRHGPFREWSVGVLYQEGNYLNGRKDGVWRTDTRNRPADSPAVEAWQRGTPHGVWEFHDANGAVVRTLEFQDGVAVRANGQPWPDPLMEKRRAMRIDNERIHQAIAESGHFDFVDTPLKDVVFFLRESHGIPVRLHARELEEIVVSIDSPITVNLKGVPLSAALVLILQPLGLVADYRYGCVTICPAAGAKDWRDRTGASEIRPRPDSVLAAAWDRPVDIDFVACPFDQVATYLSQQTGVQFDIAEVQEYQARTRDDLPITMRLKDVSLKNALGMLCDERDVYVWQRGDVLVLEMPQEFGPSPNYRVSPQ